MVIRSVEATVVKSSVVENSPNEDQGGSCNSGGFYLTANVCQRSPQDNLIWPGYVIDDSDRTVRSIMRGQIADDASQIVDG